MGSSLVVLRVFFVADDARRARYRSLPGLW